MPQVCYPAASYTDRGKPIMTETAKKSIALKHEVTEVRRPTTSSDLSHSDSTGGRGDGNDGSITR